MTRTDEYYVAVFTVDGTAPEWRRFSRTEPLIEQLSAALGSISVVPYCISATLTFYTGDQNTQPLLPLNQCVERYAGLALRGPAVLISASDDGDDEQFFNLNEEDLASLTDRVIEDNACREAFSRSTIMNVNV